MRAPLRSPLAPPLMKRIAVYDLMFVSELSVFVIWGTLAFDASFVCDILLIALQLRFLG